MACAGPAAMPAGASGADVSLEEELAEMIFETSAPIRHLAQARSQPEGAGEWSGPDARCWSEQMWESHARAESPPGGRSTRSRAAVDVSDGHALTSHPLPSLLPVQALAARAGLDLRGFNVRTAASVAGPTPAARRNVPACLGPGVAAAYLGPPQPLARSGHSSWTGAALNSSRAWRQW